ncbi:hypothetical protein HY970_00075 [Candidatus Kaiserbacteria bacterium]|nr:hypothetical protein [Candidatus Kaiserbacteria bacterium]
MAAYDVDLRAIELSRRDREYRGMQRLADELLARVHADQTPHGHQVRSRVYYELHMAGFRQWQDHLDRPRELLDRSMELAYQSRDSAELARDPLGMLHADMNISGLILPEIEMFESALTLSTQTLRDAEEIAEHAVDKFTKERAQRVGMNCMIHQVRIHMRIGGDHDLVRELWARAEENPVFQKLKAEGAACIERDKQNVERFLGG